MNWYGKIHVSIRAYYEDGHISQYYRDMYLKEIPNWCYAHSYTHPDTTKYTFLINIDKEEAGEIDSPAIFFCSIERMGLGAFTIPYEVKLLL